MKVAAIQMVSGMQWQANLARAQALMRQAVDEGVELVVLPEYFCLLGAQDTDKLAIQEPLGAGPIQAFLAESARELGLWVVGGTLPLSAAPEEGAGARVYNSTLVYSPQGDCVARYDKIHLFRFDNGRERYDESRALLSGTQPVTFDLPSRDGHRWRLGLSVCYDLRFPELYRSYAQAGADLLLVPSAFTHTTGQAHWDVLLRSRAVENLAFVLAAAQGGLHDNGRRTWGHSRLVDPWGRVLAEQAEGEAVVTAELQAGLLQQCRLQLPALEHRVL
ncbi:MAG: acyltransferase [Curvibacter sp. GWA2_64_110]|nr:MAG: acyltransferase [Curvibacter sp. GWA2_64_110]HCY16051.1 acyltransferase [Curvibacter sp.]